MLFGNKKTDDQFSSRLDKMSGYTAIGSDMMKKDYGGSNLNNSNNNIANNNGDVDTKDQIINMYRSVKSSAYNFITKSLVK